jgi:aspartokinase/homoserine dehydrogenase 1
MQIGDGKPLKPAPMVLLGAGAVGLSLLKRILEKRDYLASNYGVSVQLRAVADSQSAVIARGDSLSQEELHQVIVMKQKRFPLAGLSITQPGCGPVELAEKCCERGVVLVDCTASSQTGEALRRTLEIGGKIVLANKMPLTGEYSLYRELTEDLGRSRWETTVGSLLPVISSLNRIRSSGDRVLRITGSFSGTLGFLMTSIQEGKPFGEVVRGAHALGYTEPDPRDDLNGMDVARKALILARGSGWELGLEDVEVENLVPQELEHISLQKFLEKVGELEGEFSARVEQCRRNGHALRYAATVANEGCRVGLTDVDVMSPLGRLKGNDNLAEIHTELFSPNPLVIQGRGAGVDATAAGVLSDILELVLG